VLHWDKRANKLVVGGKKRKKGMDARKNYEKSAMKTRVESGLSINKQRALHSFFTHRGMRGNGVLSFLVDLEQFDVEAERIVGWYIRRAAMRTISAVGNDVKSGLLTQRHLLDTFIPATNDLADAESESEALTLIEHLARGEVALILHGHMVAVLRLGCTLRSSSSDNTNNTTRSLGSSLNLLADHLVLGPVSLLVLSIAIKSTMAANTAVLSLERLAVCAIIHLHLLKNNTQ